MQACTEICNEYMRFFKDKQNPEPIYVYSLNTFKAIQRYLAFGQSCHTSNQDGIPLQECCNVIFAFSKETNVRLKNILHVEALIVDVI